MLNNRDQKSCTYKYQGPAIAGVKHEQKNSEKLLNPPESCTKMAKPINSGKTDILNLTFSGSNSEQDTSLETNNSFFNPGSVLDELEHSPQFKQEKKLLFVMEINLGKSKSDSLKVFESEDQMIEIIRFCERNKLKTKEVAPKIMHQVNEQLNIFYQTEEKKDSALDLTFFSKKNQSTLQEMPKKKIYNKVNEKSCESKENSTQLIKEKSSQKSLNFSDQDMEHQTRELWQGYNFANQTNILKDIYDCLDSDGDELISGETMDLQAFSLGLLESLMPVLKIVENSEKELSYQEFFLIIKKSGSYSSIKKAFETYGFKNQSSENIKYDEHSNFKTKQ